MVSLVGTNEFRSTSERVAHQTVNQNPVVIYAGDSGITQQTITTVARLIQNISAPVLTANLKTLSSNNIRIVLFSGEQGYTQVANQTFGKLSSRVVVQTGGFTVSSTLYIPVYKYNDDTFLANTLTHELTHAELNQAGIAEKLPTWVNEGFAWYNGIAAQRQLNPTVEEAMTHSLLAQMNAAKTNGTFIPLSGAADSVLPAKPTYNVEFQDYLAVQKLISTYGIQTFNAFLQDVPRLGVHSSFAAHYPMTMAQFASEMNATSFS